MTKIRGLMSHTATVENRQRVLELLEANARLYGQLTARGGVTPDALRAVMHLMGDAAPWLARTADEDLGHGVRVAQVTDQVIAAGAAATNSVVLIGTGHPDELRFAGQLGGAMRLLVEMHSTILTGRGTLGTLGSSTRSAN